MFALDHASIVSSDRERVPTSDELDALLGARFGVEALRPFQREAVHALVAPASRVLLVAPTGGGKSLCYQLPAVALEGTALVLSPLISLMEDQVRGLEARGIPATFIASSLAREENGRRLAGLRRGEYKLVYAAPERLAFDGFLDALASASLSLVAIDEAHCIVQWGHDFRPDYLRIGAAIERLRPARVIACTATATPAARDEILRQLGWSSDDATLVLRGFARPNLHLAVEHVEGPSDAFAHVLAALRSALGSADRPSGAGIVYAATRKSTEQIADKLVERGFRAEAYHAGLDAERRARVSGEFAEGKVPVVVATNAFGMGIDRADVRVVVHAQPPASIEAYYQEVGRAGRDGFDASGLLCIAGADISLRRRLVETSSGGSAPTAAEIARAWALFRELLHYVDAATCRHDFILRYFGDDAEAIGGCGHCDVCLEIDARDREDPDARAADLDAVRRALAGVARAKGGAGMNAIAAMLAGESNDRVEKLGLARLSTFGVLRGRSQDDVMGILRVALANDWIDLTPTEFPVPVLTKLGWRVMKSEVDVRVRLPRRDRRSPARAPIPKKKGKSAAREEAMEQGIGVVFDELRRHRAKVAKEHGVPAYVVATDKALMAMASELPKNERELLAVHGMGPARVASFGEGFLDVLRARRREA